MKYLLSGALIFGLGFYVLAYHSSERLYLSCSDAAQPSRALQIEIEIFKPWVIWGDGGGFATIETYEGFLVFFDKVEVTERTIHFFRSGSQVNSNGTLSRFSGDIELEFSGLEFVGSCRRKNRVV